MRHNSRLDRLEAALQTDLAPPWPVTWEIINGWYDNLRVIDFDRFVVWVADMIENDFIEWIPNEALDKSPEYRIRGGYHASLTPELRDHSRVGEWRGEFPAACTALNWMIGTVQDSADAGEDWALTWLPLPTNTGEILNTLKAIDAG